MLAGLAALVAAVCLQLHLAAAPAMAVASDPPTHHAAMPHASMPQAADGCCGHGAGADAGEGLSPVACSQCITAVVPLQMPRIAQPVRAPLWRGDGDRTAPGVATMPPEHPPTPVSSEA